MAVADAARHHVVELVRRHLLVAGAAADPQRRPVGVAPQAIEMDAIGADAEETDGAAIELEQRLLPPARRHGEILVPPFVDAALGYERLDDAVDLGAERVEIAAGDDRDGAVGNREDRGKAPQRGGVVMAQPTDPRAAHDERQEALRAVGIAGADMVEKAHAAPSIASAR